MYRDLHNDLLPLLFAAAGIVIALRLGDRAISGRVALALQMVRPVGLWVSTFFVEAIHSSSSVRGSSRSRRSA
jgi:hypothetical protein